MVPAFAASASTTDGAGIYSLYPLNDPLDSTDELSLPYVAGLSVRVGWNHIEKSQGTYDWTLLERAHGIAVAANKRLMIRVVAGSTSPAWIYAQGVPKITFQGSETNWMPANATASMPVPWNATYLQDWEAFLTALGSEISGWQEVYCVQMTGGGFGAELNLPDTDPKTMAQWNSAGLSDAQLIPMWKTIIRAYDRSMPGGVGIVLDLGFPFAGSSTPDAVYHFALKHRAGRVWFQQNGLSASIDPQAKFPKMLDAASASTVVGYQMLGGGNFLAPQVGDRRTAFAHAIADNASYVEVYKADLMNSQLQSAMTFLASDLEQ